MFLLLNMAVEGKDAADKIKGSAAENARPKEKVKTKEDKVTNTVPASDSAYSAFSGKLLVIPMDGSHWVGIKAIAEEMGRRGHQVTVVIPEVNMRMGPGKHYDTVSYPVPYDKAYIDSVMSTHKEIMQRSAQHFLDKIKKRFSQIQSITGFIHTTAKSLLFNESLISHLGQQVSAHIKPQMLQILMQFNSATQVLQVMLSLL